MAAYVHGPSKGYHLTLEEYITFTFLDLKNRGLKKLPDWLFNCPNLEKLGLGGNDFEDIPYELANFKNLKVLSIADGKLKKITVSHLPPNLEKLYVGGNALTILPSFAETKLKTFWGEKNQIKSLPKDPFPPTLTSLNLEKNQIEALPSGFEKLCLLTSLSMEQNRLTSLPLEMATFPLDKMDLDHNSFKEIPLAVKEMKSLTTLHIRNCQITKIPEWIAIDELCIKGNPLESWPTDIDVRYLDYRDEIDWSKVVPVPNPYRD